ncbi:MarR family winged helix-turn-helix transcriptional regulator [Actinophytocola gossypii]|uniref:MarR family transcriptional regulator n=1 Tax=Actinophytocola gossypii TaxID=2812003 RepID=A0ABT2JF41_9PSEU|nr:MarR family transcriptional regulator [Actinophytocola gossypii]MCT2586331.1 MarR family transcriptional regulator [Actinophytocola gossypii]
MDPGAELGRELSTAVVMFHEAVGAHLGVTAGDQRALGVLARHGAMSAGALAKEVGLTPGAVTGMVDRLTRAGLVRRDVDPADRRRVLLTVADGAGASAEIFGSLATEMTAMISRYTTEEREVIADYLTRTVEILRDQTRRISARQR